MTKKQKVVVAMSGGVDSSVAAALLLETGYDVAGVSLRLWEYQHEDPKNCSDYRGAEKIAHLLGIPHTLLDSRSEFIREVVQPFARSYLQGSTPNPCVTCNRDFKLGVLLEWARERGADYVATGHYARLWRDPATGRYCHGDTPTLADCALVPQIFNAQRFDCRLEHVPTVMRVFEACMQHSAFQGAQPSACPDAS